MLNHNDKRKHARYPHRAYCTLTLANDACPAYLLNISKSGALVAIIDENPVKAGDSVEITIDDSIAPIHLIGRVAHVKNHYIGIECPDLSEENHRRISTIIENLEKKAAQP